jgi:hypothetical protein
LLVARARALERRDRGLLRGDRRAERRRVGLALRGLRREIDRKPVGPVVLPVRAGAGERGDDSERDHGRAEPEHCRPPIRI